MSLNVPAVVLAETTHAALMTARGLPREVLDSGHVHIPTGDVSDELLADVGAAAVRAGAATFAAGVETIIAARAGRFRSVPNAAAVPEVLLAYLAHEPIDGWVYLDTDLGHAVPCLVLDIRQTPHGQLDVTLTAARPDSYSHLPNTWRSRALRIDAACDQTRGGRPETILRRLGLCKETPAMKQQYTTHMDALVELLANGVGTRCVGNGTALQIQEFGTAFPRNLDGHMVVLDTTSLPVESPIEAELRESRPAQVPGDPDLSRMPVWPVVEVFDPAADEALVMHIADVSAHVFDDTLIDRLVLPHTHSRLLDVLTGDSAAYVTDLIAGKSAGNLILCQGSPGVGKTLTAEVYAETLNKTLYRVDLGILLGDKGVGAPIRHTLATVFERVRRWDAVLLIDEADVLVGTRGNDLARNALTAEFLRVLEYFDRLAFLTTNRPYDIDDAIRSRCAAVITYQPPTGQDAARAWQTLAALHQRQLPPPLIEQLIEAFPVISPRDMRQLLRLVAQVAAHEDREFSIDLFRECSVFRGLTPAAA
ncbi:AAA family ATPase [Nocardia sp. NPDC049220]|uniref:AAA family ATPase n=1 Tax=Nocardia sp. NPDC049220 TaxID=3155273 RepID=UPI0033E36A59